MVINKKDQIPMIQQATIYSSSVFQIIFSSCPFVLLTYSILSHILLKFNQNLLTIKFEEATL